MVMTHDVRKYMRGRFSPKFHHCCTKISRSQLSKQSFYHSFEPSVISSSHTSTCHLSPFHSQTTSCHSCHTLSSSATPSQATKISTDNPSKLWTQHWHQFPPRAAHRCQRPTLPHWTPLLCLLCAPSEQESTTSAGQGTGFLGSEPTNRLLCLKSDQ